MYSISWPLATVAMVTSYIARVSLKIVIYDAAEHVTYLKGREFLKHLARLYSSKYAVICVYQYYS